MADLHPRAPWRDVTLAGGYWNCGERLEKLYQYLRPWFRNIVAVVQESPDNTFEVAKKYADVVLPDPWLKHGNPSISRAVSAATSRYIFVVSDDEWPSEELLYSFQDLANALREQSKDGAWVHFKSTIDGIDFTREQDNHLRFFRGNLNWPASQHSRPMTENTIFWTPEGAHIRHDRSLDEMMIDYLNRYGKGLEEGTGEGQMAHNRQMMRNGCIGVSEHKGWPYVTSFPWWPQVVEHAFGGEPPAASLVVPEPVEVPRPRRGRPRK